MSKFSEKAFSAQNKLFFKNSSVYKPLYISLYRKKLNSSLHLKLDLAISRELWKLPPWVFNQRVFVRSSAAK